MSLTFYRCPYPVPFPHPFAFCLPPPELFFWLEFCFFSFCFSNAPRSECMSLAIGSFVCMYCVCMCFPMGLRPVFCFPHSLLCSLAEFLCLFFESTFRYRFSQSPPPFFLVLCISNLASYPNRNVLVLSLALSSHCPCLALFANSSFHICWSTALQARGCGQVGNK